MAREPFVVSFPSASTAEANRYAGDLVRALRDLDPELSVEQRRDRADTQDFGATLAIVLGTASITALANGIAGWLMRHSGAKIQISNDGNVVASNLDSGDAAKIAEAFSTRK